MADVQAARAMTKSHDDLDGLADRMDEAHVYSMCTEAKDEAKTKKANVTQIRSATMELG